MTRKYPDGRCMMERRAHVTNNCNPHACRNPRHGHRRNAEEDRNKDLGNIEWKKVPKGALVVEGKHAFTYHTTKGFYLIYWGSQDAREAQLHLKKMAREAWGKNPRRRRRAATNPHAGLTGLMNAREARRVMRFS